MTFTFKINFRIELLLYFEGKQEILLNVLLFVSCLPYSFLFWWVASNIFLVPFQTEDFSHKMNPVKPTQPLNQNELEGYGGLFENLRKWSLRLYSALVRARPTNFTNNLLPLPLVLTWFIIIIYLIFMFLHSFDPNRKFLAPITI